MLPYTAELQHRLYTLAYKMIGEHHSSEDLCQQVWERYCRLPTSRHDLIEAPVAYLCRMVINAALDHLKQVQQARAVYPGTWLPEPLFDTLPDRHLDVSYALTVVLTRLAPLERAVFLLRETLGHSYRDIAEWLGCTPEHCRQLYHRLPPKLKRASEGALPTAEQQGALLQAFAQAAENGDLAPLLALLQEDIRLYSDGGGKATAARNILRGATTVRAFLSGIFHKMDATWTAELAWINGQQGALLYQDGVLVTAMLWALNGEQVEELYLVRNPEKLRVDNSL